MKKIIVLLPIFYGTLAFSQISNYTRDSLYGVLKQTKKQEAIQQTLVKMFDALSNRDSVSLKNYCTADITLYEF